MFLSIGLILVRRGETLTHTTSLYAFFFLVVLMSREDSVDWRVASHVTRLVQVMLLYESNNMIRGKVER